MRGWTLGLVGCAAGAPPADLPDPPAADSDVVCQGTPTLRIGSLVGSDFEPLADGADLALASYFQGGSTSDRIAHLPLRIAIGPVDPLVIVELLLVDTVRNRPITADVPYELPLQLAPAAGIGEPWACEGVSRELVAILSPTALDLPPDEGGSASEALCGHPVRADVRVFDADGGPLAEGGVTVIAQPVPGFGERCEPVAP